MTTTIYEQHLDREILSREVLIGAIRSMLNAAEQGEDVVFLVLGNIEIDIDYESGEITAYA